MKSYGLDNEDYLGSYRRTAVNSLQFENIAETRPVSETMVSRYNVRIWEIDLIATYLPTLCMEAQIVRITTMDEARLYTFNPWLFCRDKIGSPDYWYIMLAMNQINSIFDFKDFMRPLLLPNVSQIETLVTRLERDKELRKARAS